MAVLLSSFVIGLILYFLTSRVVRVGGSILKKAITNLQNGNGGTLNGLVYNDFVKAIGPANSISYMNNFILYQWYETGYHISMVFNLDNSFRHISSEMST